jgi:hypothetical protein
MHPILQYLVAHQTLIALTLAWNFSAFTNSMRPLSPNAGYWTGTIHDYLQVVGANLNKLQGSPK